MKVKLNPNKEVVTKIRESLKETNGHCPCVLQFVWNEDTKCPCKDFRENKNCHCGLYVIEES